MPGSIACVVMPINAALSSICLVISLARRNAALTLVLRAESNDAVVTERIGTRSKGDEAVWTHAAMGPCAPLIFANTVRTSSSLVTSHVYTSSLDFGILFESVATLHPAFLSSATIAEPRYPVPPDTTARG